jgi:hypothetical protein
MVGGLRRLRRGSAPRCVVVRLRPRPAAPAGGRAACCQEQQAPGVLGSLCHMGLALPSSRLRAASAFAATAMKATSAAAAACQLLAASSQLSSQPRPAPRRAPPAPADEAAGDFFFDEAEVVAGLGPEERAAFLAQRVNFSVSLSDELAAQQQVRWASAAGGRGAAAAAAWQAGARRNLQLASTLGK